MTGVSFIVPVHNPGSLLDASLPAMLATARNAGVSFEVLLVEDGGDGSAVARLLAAYAGAPIRSVRISGAGAAAALNAGLAETTFPLIAQVDQDVVVHPGWLRALLAAMDAGTIAAVQGQYVTDTAATLLQRLMARDLEDRYGALTSDTDHVCTGNVLYRRQALIEIGGFDSQFGYGYDNDVSYRLVDAGYRLRYCAAAQSHHHWREGLGGYLRQQYGFGYGRLDLVAKHRGRLAGDAVSPAPMMLHPIAFGAALLAAFIGLVVDGQHVAPWLGTAGILVGVLTAERGVAGVRAAVRFSDPIPLLFPAVHLLRDAAWVAAIVAWVGRRALGRTSVPAHSMKPRPVDREPA